MRSLLTQYLSEIRSEHAKLLSLESTIFADDDVLRLPEPVRRYFQSCGWIGSKKLQFGRIRWENVRMRLSEKGRWRAVECDEFLASPVPLRIAHMKMRVAGLLPLEAKDQYQGGHGNMLIRLAGRITLQDVNGLQMDQSGLVTILSACLLLPSIALQPYISWSAVSEDCASATISFNGIEARGYFHFNGRGEHILFETEDRWKAARGNKFERIPWRVDLSDYQPYHGVLYPGKVIVSWVYDGYKHPYFTGKIRGIS